MKFIYIIIFLIISIVGFSKEQDNKGDDTYQNIQDLTEFKNLMESINRNMENWYFMQSSDDSKDKSDTRKYINNYYPVLKNRILTSMPKYSNQLDSIFKNSDSLIFNSKVIMRELNSWESYQNAELIFSVTLCHENNYEFFSKVNKDLNELISDLKFQYAEETAKKETKNKIVKFALVFSALFVFLVIIFLYFILKSKKRVQLQNKLITEQKSILEHQKQEITDSINYSKRIQTAILPDLVDIKQSLSDFFILYQPKDIVSGDFYYFNKVNNDVFMAAADCTGHGVPGAFMSLVGSKELKIANSLTNSPAEILKHLNNGVKDTLRQNHIDGTKDGMDIALVRINGTTVTYSAANRPLWILKKNSDVIEEIKATKTAIAGFTEDDFEFEEHELTLSKGDTIYLFSDGYADQFGGDKQKKMTTKRFREFILSLKDQTMTEQQLALGSYFRSWKGNTEQVDDLLVIGIKI